MTLARGLPCPPCKRSARDNSPTGVNFPPSCVTRSLANLIGIVQFQSLITKHLINKKLFSVYDDNIFPFFREFNVLSIENFKIISNFRLLQRMSRMTKHVIKAGKVDPGDSVTLPGKFTCKPELTLTRLLG